MTTVAVLADPPRDGLVLPGLTDSTPLSTTETTDLYTAMLRDVCRAVEDSGGELLVNYRAADDTDEDAAESELRDALRPALGAPDDARFEVQVGSSFAARAGNTVTHLLEEEGVKTAAVVEPTAPFLARQVVDNAAMKFRRSEAVLGPAPNGRVYYAGFAEPIDFTDAFAPPAVGTLTDRAADAGLDVDFLEMRPVVETAADLAETVALLSARERADSNRPAYTTEFLLNLGVDVVERDGELTVVRE
ncbi:hypothetical protein [Halorientalis litorea]|jgi:glycosyltransferase A (GT-A) superfamily protein (DUF2064 family)|uniref:hypothetical protein n=1 Tax=Halorientalis litorea TaxID=2931977 RepID=UPI001FF30A12|nr:hypothetical protein [Halorientalis litorea]